MKKIFYLSVILFGTIFINIPKYIELNNLAIIDTVTIKQNEGNYFLNLKEVIPIKDENGIKYQYEYYNSKCKEIGICLKKIEEDTRKNIFKKNKEPNY